MKRIVYEKLVVKNGILNYVYFSVLLPLEK